MRAVLRDLYVAGDCIICQSILPGNDIYRNQFQLCVVVWVDTFHNAEMFFSPWLIFHAFAVVPIVFFSCFVLDQVRIRYIERPFFRWWDRHEARWGKLARKQVDSFLKRMGA